MTGSGPRLTVELEQRRTASPILQSYRGQAATVRVNRELTARAGTPGGRSVRHLEITLPAGTTYAAGDHLGVLPRNDVSVVNRVLARFGLDAGQYVTLTATGGTPTHLPIGEPYPLLGILAGCVELQDVASRAGLAAMAAHMPEGPARDELAGLAGTDDESKARYREKIAVPRRTLLDLLEEHPECDLPFAEFLDLLPPLRPRYYSISSSPTMSSDVSLTVGVLEGPARSGDGSTFRGVCSGHLSDGPRARHRVRVRPAADHRLPAAGEPARSDDHGRRRHRDGPVPRVPAGTGVAAGPGRPDRHVAAVPRLPRPRGRPASTPTS